MANETDYQQLLDRLAALREGLTNRFAGDLITNPQLADALMKQIDDLFLAAVKQDQETTPPPDKGLAQLVGVGPEAADEFGKTRIPQGVEPYDEQITSERIVAVGDLYYIYQHEKIGVFRVIRKLKELFHAGAVRLSSGHGRFPALSIRSPRSAALHAQRSPDGLPARLRLRQRPGADTARRRTSISTISSAISSIRSRCTGATSASAT